MTDQINFRDKKGKLKYIADSKGNLVQVQTDGKLKHLIQATESNKEETVKIQKNDLQ